MRSITTFFVITALILIGIAVYIIIRQNNNVKYVVDDLNLAITQAQTVRKDLVQIMEDALDLSTSIVNDIDKKITEIGVSDVNENNYDEVIPNNKIINVDKKENEDKISELKTIGSGNKRIRVYELAKTLNITNKEIILAFEKLGWNIRNHLSTLSAEQIEAINTHFDSSNLNEHQKNNNYIPDMDLKADEQFSDSEYASFINNLKTAHPYLAVRTLYEKGFSVKEIAQLLERGQGEIELILNLSRKKQAL
ncbi:MAG: translation initiation factor IF-2 N-terminal domain-containing protein [Syntrophomonas sp.]